MFTKLLKEAKSAGKDKILILAFPTLGKSTLVYEINEGIYGEALKGRAVDLDYPKGDLMAYTDDLKEGNTILVNALYKSEVKVIATFAPWVNLDDVSKDVYIKGYLPESSRMVVLRGKERDGVGSFMKAFIDDGDYWIAGWKEQFSKHNISYITLRPYEYISDWY